MHLVGAETVDRLDPHAKVLHSLRRRTEVLFGKDGRRAHERRLLSRQNTAVGGAEGDLRLAEAHVPAKKSVHHLIRTHIFFDLFEGNELIRRFLVRKRRRELLHLLAVFGKDKSVPFSAFLIELLQIERHLFERGPDARLDPFELSAADL